MQTATVKAMGFKQRLLNRHSANLLPAPTMVRPSRLLVFSGGVAVGWHTVPNAGVRSLVGFATNCLAHSHPDCVVPEAYVKRTCLLQTCYFRRGDYLIESPGG